MNQTSKDNNMKTSQTILVNNTSADLGAWNAYLVAAVRDGAPLPAELADLLVVTIIEVDDGRRGIISWK